MFSPGNLRATFDNPNYERLLSHYIGEKYTLRYTGGMVPDVFQIIVKEKGVFSNVTSPSTKAKLRILFEVAPLGLLVRLAFNDCHWRPASRHSRDRRRKYQDSGKSVLSGRFIGDTRSHLVKDSFVTEPQQC